MTPSPLCWIAALVWVAPLTAQVHRLPRFDLEKAEAYYVVSLPDTYDKAKRWPLILDFHGAAAPSRRGAELTRKRLWSRFVAKVPCIVVGVGGRTRAWGQTTGDKNDKAYALAVLSEVRKQFSIDPARIYLSGFSSGSDFLCKRNLQALGPFAASLVTCPGPANVIGLRGGELLRMKAHPFLFVTGEQDYIRKDGAWKAFVALDEAGARVMYREVPGTAHAFFPLDEYVRLFARLERMASGQEPDRMALARQAIALEDYLWASTLLLADGSQPAKTLLDRIEATGKELLRSAAAIDAEREPGRAYEAWWRLETQFHRFSAIAKRARAERTKIASAVPRRDLYRARYEWFRSRARRAATAPEAHKRREPGAIASSRPWAFDRYLDYEQLTDRVQRLARDYPERVRLRSIGRSIQGRDIWLLELTERSTGEPQTKPAAFVQAAIHGNEISTQMTALYMAWQCAANPDRRRSVDRVMRDTTLYVVPAVNPDATHHFMTEPYSYWRPRLNFRPDDADGDGRVDEDGQEDLDGDGEIGLMYRKDPNGAYVLKDGRLVRGTGGQTYTLLGREGRDNDGDGRLGEDPAGGVDLNRNFPVGFTSRRRFGGTSGPKALSEPETRAIAGFVGSHPNIDLFFDYHNAADCVFYWRSEHRGDLAILTATAERAHKALAYAPKRLDHTGAGLSIAWAYGAHGIFGFIVELEATRGRADEYYRSVWGDKAFQKPRPFDHPDFGPVLIGNDYTKLARRNPHPSDIVWQAERNWAWLRRELGRLPRLELVEPRIEASDQGFVVTGRVRNAGRLPLDSERRVEIGAASRIRIEADGARLSGTDTLDTLGPGREREFRVSLAPSTASVTLRFRHPRAGQVELPVRRARCATVPIRTRYDIEAGYATPDSARGASNDWFRAGRQIGRDRGPRFALRHDASELRIAVLLGEWADFRHRVPAAEFEKALFSRGEYTGTSATGQYVYGSLNDFYAEMSYGRMKVTGKVFDWVELPGKRARYRDASFGSSIVTDALTAAVLAKHGEGALDGFDGYVFVWAGNAVRRTSALWPMRIKLKDRPGKAAFKMGEFHKGEFAAVGVACHEMGHTFGVDDKYGLGATKNPLGQWCLMAKGTHGGGASGRHRPFHMCAWCKMVIGWVDPVVIDPRTPQKLALRPISSGPRECYRILLEPDGSRYLLLENRRREGFHTELPSAGLVVLEVGPSPAPAFPQKGVQLLPAHGRPPASRGVVAAPEAVAWPLGGRTELTVAGVTLSKIRLVDDVIYFEVGG